MIEDLDGVNSVYVSVFRKKGDADELPKNGIIQLDRNQIPVLPFFNVEMRGGERLHFVVTEIGVYPYTDTPTPRIFNEDDAAHLNLITCEGKWVKADKTYDERLVVYTTLLQS